jgi:hypothetical protein
MEVQDKSVIQPVLRAVESLQAVTQGLDTLYEVVDQFCAVWIGKTREQMLFEGDMILYLTHELLGEYLHLEENNKRVAFWMLTLNRCCTNFDVDLRPKRRELEKLIENSDLGLDGTLLEPIFSQIRDYQQIHNHSQAEELGESDALGSFLQWVGAYCSYIYPTIIRDRNKVTKTVISAISFLISEYIKLRSNASRMAALLLGIKEACVYGSSVQAGGEFRPCAPTESIPAGQDEQYVEALLQRLRQEG